MAKPPSKTTLRGRDGRDGRFVPLERVPSNPDRYTRERVPKPGYGDTKNDRK